MSSSKHSPLRTTIASFLNWIGKTAALTALQWQIARERSALARLTDDELRDIGVSREDALQESRRSAFEIPENRLKRTRTQRKDRAEIGSATQPMSAKLR